MKKILILGLLLLLNIPMLVLAEGSDTENPGSYTRTILPEINKEDTNIQSNSDCTFIMKKFEEIYFFDIADEPEKNQLSSLSRFSEAVKLMNEYERDPGIDPDFNYDKITRNDILGCSIVTGRISLAYLSIFISYALNAIAILGGSLSMIFIMIGGYKYLIGSLQQSTDDAKKTILNAIIGLAVSTGAWIIVNVVMSVLTG